MLNDDDFPALPNSTGQNSQQQVFSILQINYIKCKIQFIVKKNLSGTITGNEELKRRHRLAIESNDKVGIQTHPDGN